MLAKANAIDLFRFAVLGTLPAIKLAKADLSPCQTLHGPII